MPHKLSSIVLTPTLLYRGALYRLAGNKLRQDRDPHGNTIYRMSVRDDRFLHFTFPERADQIVQSGLLRMRPPYKGSGADAIFAISLVYGIYVPRTQVTHHRHQGDPPLVGVTFRTTVAPYVGHIEEVAWHRDVPLLGAQVIPYKEGLRLLRHTPERLPNDTTYVLYDEYDPEPDLWYFDDYDHPNPQTVKLGRTRI
jgi:hypothetical protein